jgi:hypothetical protein
MRSNRLALVAVLAGVVLLGFSSRGVVLIGSRVPAAGTGVVVHGDHDGHHDGEHHHEQGV